MSQISFPGCCRVLLSGRLVEPPHWSLKSLGKSTGVSSKVEWLYLVNLTFRSIQNIKICTSLQVNSSKGCSSK